jgi:hypothetical protein
MIKKYLALCVCLIAVTDVLGQSHSKQMKQPRPVKQPREVVEAYQVCEQFQRLLAEDFDFDRAFEATFTKNPTRRREIAIAETELDDEVLAQLDDVTLIGLYKDLKQLLILSLPLFGVDDVDESELFPASFEKKFKQKPKDLQNAKVFAVQLKRDLADYRVHINKLAGNYPSVSDGIATVKKHLLTPLEPPNHIVKPMTAYSKGRVLRPDEKYYQIHDCAVIREGGEMRLVGWFIKFRG